MNGLGDVEVVVEAVLDRRADAQLGLGEQLLDGLGQHVRGRVPQDRAALVGARSRRARPVAVGELVGEVAQLAVDPGGDHGAAVGF